MICTLLHGCSSVRLLDENEKLIVKEEFSINGEINSKDPVSQLSLTPANQNLLGLPLKLHIYNLADADPSAKFDEWLQKRSSRENKLNSLLSPKQVKQLKKYYVDAQNWLKKVGEAPSLIDSSKISLTNELIRKYYQNIGYFNAESKETVSNLDPKKASIKYTIKTGPIFTLDSISSVIASKDIDSLFKANKSESLLKPGDAFVVDKINAERDRIINFLRNNGIINFQQRSIRFKAFKDSLGIDTKIPVVVEIKNAQKRIQDTLTEIPYKIQKIKSISLFIENDENTFSIYTDSISFQNIKLFSVGKLNYRPEVLTKGVSVKKDMPFSYKDRTTTYRYFNELQNFKYPSIVYTPSSKDSTYLDASIYLTPKERFSLGFDFDVSHSNIQDIGVTLGTSIISRNVFRGAEILEFGIKGTIGSSRDVAEEKNTFFNLFEVGGNLNLRIPRLLAPSFIEKLFFEGIKVNTNILFGVSLQDNIGLDRQSFTGNLEYEWKPTPFYTLNFKLADIEFVNNQAIDNYFNVYRNSFDRLTSIAQSLANNPYLNDNSKLDLPEGADSFINDVLSNNTSIEVGEDRYVNISNISERKKRLTANNFIVGSSFTLLKNNQENILDENFSQFRFKLEWVGNLLNGLLKLTDTPMAADGSQQIFNLAPSQYFKSEMSYIKHWEVGPEKILAFRGFSGIAIPYGNSNSIPFTRSYYAGGANDNRAWKAYKLGPGTSSGINEFNEANFKVALNLEYRFPIIGAIKGALFVDAGNIWNINNNIDDVTQSFNSIHDLNQLAIGSGVGIRYDFDYFIFRLDTAFKTYDPSMAPDNRWGSQLRLDKAVYNIGINYPF